MHPLRRIYDQLPLDLRVRIRSMLPDGFLRWYANRNTDIYLISYPKCGRTWLRLMIGRAVTRHFNLPDQDYALLLHSGKALHPSAPRITVVHDDRPMNKAPEELETSKRRYKDKKVIFLARDPRDVIVSSYFETMKRSHLFRRQGVGSDALSANAALPLGSAAGPDQPGETSAFNGTLPEFIHRRKGGFDTILRYYNIWAENRTTPRDFLLVRYEDMRQNTARELRRVLDFLGLTEVSEATLNEAVEFASFENMRRMEAEGRFQDRMLQPADQADPESYKTRKGKVKGFVEYLNEREITTLNQKLAADLSDYFGYAPEPAHPHEASGL